MPAHLTDPRPQAEQLKAINALPDTLETKAERARELVCECHLVVDRLYALERGGATPASDTLRCYPGLRVVTEECIQGLEVLLERLCQIADDIGRL